MTTTKPSLVEQKTCVDCGKPTLGSLDALGEQPICYRPCYLLRQVKRIHVDALLTAVLVSREVE